MEEGENGCGGLAVEEEKWRFQAEMMRAECNLLRMEKEIAVKKLQRTRVKMDKTLRSAVHTLVSVSHFSLSVFLIISVLTLLSGLFDCSIGIRITQFCL